METSERNLANDLQLNKFALDEEAERMGNALQYWTELKEKCSNSVDNLYVMYKLAKADAYMKNKLTPTK